MKIGEIRTGNLFRLLEEAGLSVGEFAKKAGVTAQAINRIKYSNSISDEKAEEYAKLLHVSKKEFYRGFLDCDKTGSDVFEQIFNENRHDPNFQGILAAYDFLTIPERERDAAHTSIIKVLDVLINMMNNYNAYRVQLRGIDGNRRTGTLNNRDKTDGRPNKKRTPESD